MFELLILYVSISAIQPPNGTNEQAFNKAREALLVQTGSKDATKKAIENTKKQVCTRCLQTLQYSAIAYGVYKASRKGSVPFSASPASGSIGKEKGVITFTWRF